MLKLDTAITVTIYGAKSAEENIYQGVVIEPSRIGDVPAIPFFYIFKKMISIRRVRLIRKI